VTVTVTTAQSLTADQKKKLTTAVEKKHGQKVELQEIVEPSVIGGFKVHFGSTEYDATISGKLEQLRQELLNTIG
jgi:F-type H+-transporting ATPase subunit delta